MVGSDGEVVRLVGTLTDVTEFKNAEERLLHDAVHDNLTGLPNRELFLDRLEAALRLRQGRRDDPPDGAGDRHRPLQAGQRFGRHRGRRFDPAHHRAPPRPPAQAAGHAGAARRRPVRAASCCPSSEPARIVAFAETLRRTLRAPITFNDREIFLTASIGLALADSEPHRTEEVLKDAELAMYHAKRIGGDRIEVFKPAMRSRKTDRLTLESDLRRAIEREEITVLYQPIVRLEDRAVAGFEALVRWDHPKLGRLSPAEFIPHRRGDRPDRRSRPVRARAHRAPARDLAAREPRLREPIFASVNVSSRQLLRHDLIQDLRTRAGALARSRAARSSSSSPSRW